MILWRGGIYIYKILINEILTKEVIIAAKSIDEAIRLVKEQYLNESIILYPEDCNIEVEFKISEKGIL